MPINPHKVEDSGSTPDPASNLALEIDHLGNGNDAPPTLSGQRYDRPVSSECPAFRGELLHGRGTRGGSEAGASRRFRLAGKSRGSQPRLFSWA